MVGAGRARVEKILQEQKAHTKALLSENRHLVEALRDALLERHELIGREITDILIEASRANGSIDLRDHATATGGAATLVSPATPLPEDPAQAT
jgi:cell division protease FtsH